MSAMARLSPLAPVGGTLWAASPGNALQPDVLLHLDDSTDRLVFDLAQIGAMLFAGCEHFGRTQEAADVIGAEGGLGSCGQRPIPRKGA